MLGGHGVSQEQEGDGVGCDGDGLWKISAGSFFLALYPGP